MKNRGGFTIIETLIVLAVSGAMFTIMAVFFSGRQDRVEFSQGMRDIDSEIRDVVNDIRNGFYPNPNQKCSTASGSITFSPSNPSVQGTNDSCIFAGKTMLFDSISTNSITSYSIAGFRKAESLSGLKPALMGSSGEETAEQYLMPADIKLVNKEKQPIKAAITLLFDITSVNWTGGSVNVAPFKNTVSSTIKDSVANMFASTATAKEIDNNGLVLCFISGNNDRFAILNLKRSVDGLSSEILINQSIASAGCWDGTTL